MAKRKSLDPRARSEGNLHRTAGCPFGAGGKIAVYPPEARTDRRMVGSDGIIRYAPSPYPYYTSRHVVEIPVGQFILLGLLLVVHGRVLLGVFHLVVFRLGLLNFQSPLA